MVKIYNDFGVVEEVDISPFLHEYHDVRFDYYTYYGNTGTSGMSNQYMQYASRRIVKCSYCGRSNWNNELECCKCGAPLW